jgi:hypothetical protein
MLDEKEVPVVEKPAPPPAAAKPAEEVTFADYAHGMGPQKAALANALRVTVGVKKTEMASRKLDPAKLDEALAKLAPEPKDAK